MFYQLGLTINERRIVTEAIVKIASEVGIKCLTAKATNDKALL